MVPLIRLTRAAMLTMTAFALIVAAAAIWLFVRPSADQQLQRAISNLQSRPIEGRITEAPYASYVPTNLAASDHLDNRSAAVTALRSRGASLHNRVLAHLLLGDREAALRLLQRRGEDATTGGGRQADIAALLHAQASANDDVVLMTTALATADAALERNDAAKPVALFNHGLILETLGLAHEASRSYRASAGVDAHPKWRAESTERARRLSTATRAEEWDKVRLRLESGDTGSASAAVQNFPQQARAWAETDYLGRWGDCVLAGDACAARWLATARTIGEALGARSGERLLLDAVASIDRNHDDVTILARAHRAYRDARKLNRDRKVAASLARYVEAEQLFRSGGSPMALMATYLRANAITDEARFGEALAVLDRIECGSRYIALCAQLEWERGRIFARLGRLHEAMEVTGNAAALFTRLGESDNATRMRASMASGLTLLGRSADAWRARRDVFRAASASGDDAVLELALNSAARAAIREKRWAVARSFFALQLSLEKTTPRYRFDALLWSTFCSVRIKRDGSPDLRDVYAAAAALPDQSLREEAMDDARFADAILSRDADASRALTLLNEVIEFRSSTRRELRMPEAFAERARVWRRLGRSDSEIKDFNEAIAILERQRKSVVGEDLRDAFFGTASEIFADQAYALADRGAFTQAFEIIDRGTARVLLDRFPDPAPMPPQQIADELPRNITIVQYACGTNGTVLSMASVGRVTAVRVPATRATITEVSKEHVSALATNDAPRIAETGKQLHSWLIEPVFSEFPSTETIVAVTDDVTAAVAFPALWNARANRYLIEEAAFLIAPSATSYVRLTMPHKPMIGARVLTLADPDFDRALFPDLPRLAHAAAEATAIRKLYTAGTLLVGSEATPARFMEEAEKADVIHVASHAIVDPFEHARSVIPLAATDDDRGVLYSSAIKGLNLARSPIVVLAACHSAMPTAEPGTIRSLSLSFIAAGSRSVVGARWEIDDADTREFTVALHRDLATHQPAEAVRRAQLTLLKSPNRALNAPRQWAAFQAFGY